MTPLTLPHALFRSLPPCVTHPHHHADPHVDLDLLRTGREELNRVREQIIVAFNRSLSRGRDQKRLRVLNNDAADALWPARDAADALARLVAEAKALWRSDDWDWEKITAAQALREQGFERVLAVAGDLAALAGMDELPRRPPAWRLDAPLCAAAKSSFFALTSRICPDGRWRDPHWPRPMVDVFMRGRAEKNGAWWVHPDGSRLPVGRETARS